ncbi:hypothetical protein D3C72_1547330 [compost metagenome]
MLSGLRFALLPVDGLSVERDRRDRHLGRAVGQFARVGEVDQRVVLAVVDPGDEQVFPDQRQAGAEDFLAFL